MNYDWYKVINRTQFEASGLVSKEVVIILEDIGQKTVLVTKGRLVSLVYEDVMLSIGVTDANPFAFGGKAVYQDANADIWLGFEVAE